MKTDPISAGAAYRMALERVLRAETRQEARKLASAALAIPFDRPEAGTINVSSGYGMNTQQPFVTIALASPIETANPAVQLASSQAREIALQILEAAEAAEQDGFIVTFVTEAIGAPVEEAGKLLHLYREHRAAQRGE
jgi:hypothetical protein